MSDAGTTSDPTGTPLAAPQMPWWQWIIVYPTLFVAILGALPTLSNLIKSQSLPVSVPLAKVDEAQEQLALLKVNLSCTQEAMSHPLKTRDSITIGAVVCDSGDVAIVAQDAHAGSYPNPLIVPWKSIVNEGLAAQVPMLLSLSPIAPAYAQNPAPPSVPSPASAPTAAVICQRLQDKGNLLRRIKTLDGSCVDVVSNVYNRQLVKKTPAPCVPTC